MPHNGTKSYGEVLMFSQRWRYIRKPSGCLAM